MRSFGLLLSCVALGSAASWGTGCSSASSGGGNGSGGTPPHALGTILVGEAHAPGAATSTPTVSAQFLPDAALAPAACTTQVAGCTVAAEPQCGAMVCGSGATCAWDAACQPTCQPLCTLTCGTGQECYFASPGQPACRTTESFDAGALVFVGTTSPITLFPPYQYPSTASVPPFSPAAQIQVQASGATGAGFDAFTSTTTATAFVKTSPPLDTIPAAMVFGLGALPIGWVPGSDTVTITLMGSAGTIVTCPADDSTGQFQVPRAAIQAAQGTSGGSSLTVAVTRERDDWNQNASTHGTLTTATVQPVGWVELSTSSTEGYVFDGCPDPTQTLCPDGCYDLSDDPLHCGSCTVICSSSQTCGSGQCTTGSTTTDCDDCQAQAQTGACAAAYSTCDADPSCASAGECVQTCAGDATCVANCETEYVTGYSEYSSLEACVCETACVSPCATQCAAQ
jgi:hypothetical protein